METGHRREADGRDPGAGESSFSRGLRILLALSGGARRSIGEIAEAVDLPLSTAYRYIRELKRLRLVDEVGSGIYAAGAALFGLALGAPFAEQLRRHAQPALERLAARTGETAMLSVRVDLGASVVAQVESPQPMRLSFTPGSIHALHAGATASVLLAFETREVIDQVLSRPLERFTPDTITDRAVLERRLADIRAAGFAVSHGEADRHASAVAVPVFHGDQLLCGLSVSGPSPRFGKARIREFAALLTEESTALGRLLTFPPEAAPTP